MPDGMVEIRDARGATRRVRLISCAECEAELPDYIFGRYVPLDARMAGLCPQCQEDLTAATRDYRRIQVQRKRYDESDLPYQRRIRILALASPRWRDRAAIRAIYAEARRLTRETGIQYHVDHYYPLQGDLCCGLHVHQNLRIITAAENCSKHKRHPVDQSPALML